MSGIRELTAAEIEMISGGDMGDVLVLGGSFAGFVAGAIGLGAAVTVATPVALAAGIAGFAAGTMLALGTVYNYYSNQGASALTTPDVFYYDYTGIYNYENYC